MGSSFVMFSTKGHRGQVRLTIEFDSRGENNLTTYIHKIREASEYSHLWAFQNKFKIILKPSIAFDKDFLTKKEIAQGYDIQLWQPDFLYVNFSSNTGCVFQVELMFVEEEL